MPVVRSNIKAQRDQAHHYTQQNHHNQNQTQIVEHQKVFKFHQVKFSKNFLKAGNVRAGQILQF